MKNNETIILSIGTGAQNIVNCFYGQNKNFNILCIGNNKETLNESNTKTLYFEDITPEFLWKQIVENKIKPHKRLSTNQIALLRKELAGYKNLVIVSALGGSFSSYMTSAFIELVMLLNLNFKIVITLPLSFEGDRRTFASQQAFSELEEIGCITGKNLFIYKNDSFLSGDDSEFTDISGFLSYRKRMKNTKTIEDAFREIDKEVTKIIAMILELNNK